MFKFQGTWPEWVPYFGGGQVFPAIWNVADGSITLGVVMVFFRQRKYFPKEEKVIETDSATEQTMTSEDTPSN